MMEERITDGGSYSEDKDKDLKDITSELVLIERFFFPAACLLRH